MNASFLRAQRLLVFLSLLSKKSGCESCYMHRTFWKCLGLTVQWRNTGAFFYHLSYSGGWHLNAIIFVLGSSVPLLRSKDSQRDRRTWAGTPRIQSSVPQVSHAGSHCHLLPGAWLGAQMVSVWKETASFSPTHMAKQRKQSSMNVPAQAFIFICKDKVNTPSCLPSWMI